MGRAASLHLRPYMLPSRTPKDDWPARSTGERCALHLQRTGLELSLKRRSSRQVRSYQHTQFLTRSVGDLVGLRLAGAACDGLQENELAREDVINQMAFEVPVAEPPDIIFCSLCCKRCKLIFTHGIRSRAQCLCFRLKTRRMTNKQPDALGAFDPPLR